MMSRNGHTKNQNYFNVAYIMLRNMWCQQELNNNAKNISRFVLHVIINPEIKKY